MHKGDLTGIEIVNRVMEQVLALDVRALEEHRAIELIPARDGSGVAGALLIDVRTGGYRFVAAKAVLLATGGGPTMYLYHTPSGDKSCDGMAMALRAGLALRDMEMVQFHPTGLLAGPETRMTGTVLEEGLRGVGGYLLNGGGERFMERFDPAAERATRDVVSRAIYAEMRAGRTTPMGGVYIEMAHLGPENVARRFPGMVKRCADCGFDLAGGRVEVVPTAHYMMGGVEFEADCTTALPRLYAAGEDCGGGARREPARRQRRRELHGVRGYRRRGDGAGGGFGLDMGGSGRNRYRSGRRARRASVLAACGATSGPRASGSGARCGTTSGCFVRAKESSGGLRGSNPMPGSCWRQDSRTATARST